MRRAILIVSALLMVFCVAAVTYSAYLNSEEELLYDDIKSRSISLSAGGYFEGEFASDVKGKELCGYDYEINGKTLYITVLATAGTKRELLPTNDAGYCKIRINVGTKVEKIYYRVGDDKDKLEFTKS